MDYHDKSALMNLNLCLAIKHNPIALQKWFNEFNHGRRSLKDKVRDGCPKTDVLPKNIDTEREPIIQDRHVTYHEKEPSLHISPTSLHSILYEQLAVKKICSRWIPHNLTIASKRVR